MPSAFLTAINLGEDGGSGLRKRTPQVLPLYTSFGGCTFYFVLFRSPGR
jgi:hypothetical protein